MRRGLALLMAGTFATSAAAGGSPPAGRPSIHYEAPTGCPGPEAFSDAMAALARRGPAPRAPEAIRVTIEAAGDRGYVGTLEVGSGSERTTPRVVTAKTCDDLTETLVFMTALVLGLSVEPRRPPPREAPPPPPPPAPPALPPEPAPSPAPPPWVWTGAAGTEVALLSLAGPSLRGAAAPFVAFGASRGGALAPEVRLRFLHAQSGSIATPVASAALSLDVAGLDLCPVRLGLGEGSFLRPCAGLEAGAFRGEPYQGPLVNGHAEARGWAAVTGSLRLTWLVAGRLELGAQLGAAFPLTPYRFTFGSSTVIYDQPAVGVEAALGVGLRLW